MATWLNLPVVPTCEFFLQNMPMAYPSMTAELLNCCYRLDSVASPNDIKAMPIRWRNPCCSLNCNWHIRCFQPHGSWNIQVQDFRFRLDSIVHASSHNHHPAMVKSVLDEATCMTNLGCGEPWTYSIYSIRRWDTSLYVLDMNQSHLSPIVHIGS